MLRHGNDISRQIATLKKCEIITEAQVKELCLKAREILVEEANVQWIDAPVTVRPICQFCVAAADSCESLYNIRSAVTSMDSSMIC